MYVGISHYTFPASWKERPKGISTDINENLIIPVNFDPGSITYCWDSHISLFQLGFGSFMCFWLHMPNPGFGPFEKKSWLIQAIGSPQVIQTITSKGTLIRVLLLTSVKIKRHWTLVSWRAKLVSMFSLHLASEWLEGNRNCQLTSQQLLLFHACAIKLQTGNSYDKRIHLYQHYI